MCWQCVCSPCRRGAEQQQRLGQGSQSPPRFHLLCVCRPVRVTLLIQQWTTFSAISPCTRSKPRSLVWWSPSAESKWYRPDRGPTPPPPLPRHLPQQRGRQCPSLNCIGAGTPELKGWGLLETTGRSTRRRQQQRAANQGGMISEQH